MRILDSNEYIGEKLDIQPVTRARLDDLKEPAVDDNIKKFIKYYNLVWNPTTKRYDCDESVAIGKPYIIDGAFPIKFGHIKGDFNCDFTDLESLEGAPTKVDGSFACEYNKLTSLESAPKYVGGNFICDNNSLKALKGTPEYVGGYFDCCNNKLTSLEGAPTKIDGYFNCDKNKLITLNGAPQKVNGDFYCRNNKLVSFEGAPQCIKGNMYCKNNPSLVLPKRKPSWIKGDMIEK